MKTIDKSGQEKKEYALRLPNRKYGYFRDDQIIVFITHKEDMIPEETLNSNNDLINEAVKSKKDDAFVSPNPRVDTIRRLPKNAEQDNQRNMLSILTYQVEEAPEDPSYLLGAIDFYNNKIPKDNSIYDRDHKEQLDNSPNTGENNNQPGNTDEKSRIVGASANWLASVTSKGIGTGGPGGRPSPFRGSCKNAPAGFGDLIMSLKNKKLYGDGTGVDVAILDTAPSAHALVAAPDDDECPDHPLIATLLGSEGKLRLHPAPYDEVLRLGNNSLNDHDYIMTDHGLFVAGIVHSIVPKANIHLIEVLNQYGVGDLLSFTRGLGVVLNELYSPDRKLVINCSWMLEFPFHEFHIRHKNQTESNLDAEFERQVFQFAQTDNSTAALLKFLFDQFSTLGQEGRHAIAAAGNDGREGDAERIKARYPAAIPNVMGVGALPRTLIKDDQGKYKPSIYSNLADDPAPDGIMTLGGEEGEGNGVLGVYIGEFPKDPNPSLWRKFLNWLIILLGGRVAGPRNLTKWAWWAGTSFATPVLTGTVAAALSSSNQIATTHDALNRLIDLKIIAGSSLPGTVEPGAVVTKENEDVLAVTQT